MLKMQADKPGSVPRLLHRGSYHLSGDVIADGLNQPTHPDTPTNQRWERAALPSGLFGLSTRKVCHAPDITAGAVGTYSTFSPFPPGTRPQG